MESFAQLILQLLLVWAVELEVVGDLVSRS